MAAHALDRVFWSICIAAGSLVFAACLLPGIRVGVEGSTGSGQSQQSFAVEQTITLVSYPRPGTFIYLIGAVLLVAAGVAGILRGSSVGLAAIPSRSWG